MISIKSTGNTQESIIEFYSVSQRTAMSSNNYFNSETDVLFVLNDGIIPAHAVILQAVSPFFQQIFSSQGPFFVGTRQILLPEFSVKVMRPLIQLLYSQEVNLSSESEARDVLKTMDCLGIIKDGISLKKPSEPDQPLNKTRKNDSTEKEPIQSKSKSTTKSVLRNEGNGAKTSTPSSTSSQSSYKNTDDDYIKIPEYLVVPHMTELVNKNTNSEQQQQPRTIKVEGTNRNDSTSNVGKLNDKPIMKSLSNPLKTRKVASNCSTTGGPKPSTQLSPSKRIKLVEQQFTEDQINSLKECSVRSLEKNGKTYVFVFRKKIGESCAIKIESND